MKTRSLLVATAVAAVAFTAGPPAAPAGAQALPLDLVVEDVESDLGAEVSVIVRTVADLPLKEVAFDLVSRERDLLPIAALASLVSATALPEGGDLAVQATFDAPSQRTSVTITSPTGSINPSYGPLVALRYQLAGGLADRQRFFQAMDPDGLVLTLPDDSIHPGVAGRGRLRLVVPDPPPEPVAFGLSGLGGESYPGGVAVFGVASVAPYALGGGTVELLFDPAFLDGDPVVKIDPRYGSAVVDSVDDSVAGRLLVTFHSPAGDLNADLHGLFLSVAAPSRADIVPPATFAFALGPATALTDPAGDPLLLESEADPITFLDPEILLLAAFEGGDLGEFFFAVP